MLLMYIYSVFFIFSENLLKSIVVLPLSDLWISV